jgi:hypothetical protein
MNMPINLTWGSVTSRLYQTGYFMNDDDFAYFLWASPGWWAWY